MLTVADLTAADTALGWITAELSDQASSALNIFLHISSESYVI